MRRPHQITTSVLRRKPLAVCLAGIFTTLTPLAFGASPTTWTVNVCDQANTNSGPTTGSLRFAVASAASGDIVDMTGLTCSPISLTTGAITIYQSDLTLNGPGQDKLTISNNGGPGDINDRIINHQGSGAVTITGLTLASGQLNTTGVARGGCIYSKGGVALYSASVNSCTAQSSAKGAYGGGIFTVGALTAKYSTISGNHADSTPGIGQFAASGGGANVSGNAFIKYSSIGNNVATAGSGHSYAGGLSISGSTTSILASTISGNSAGARDGGLELRSQAANAEAAITNSTITGNSAALTGGMYSNLPTLTIRNSTIASNTAARGSYYAQGYQPGVGLVPYTVYVAPGIALSSSSITIESSIIADNSYGGDNGVDVDIGVAVFPFMLDIPTVSVSGANNLIGSVEGVPVLDDTIQGKCPLLGPLRDNGGPTYTRALLSHSPAIDKGNDIANLGADQRGGQNLSPPLPVPRTSGLATDIGAYEVQQEDVIFNAAFDGCVGLSL